MRPMDGDALAEYFSQYGGTTFSGYDVANILKTSTSFEIPTDPKPEPTHHDLIMRAVRAALCAKDRRSVRISADGDVSIWPQENEAMWIHEADRRNHWHCSACGAIQGVACGTMKYCPDCGAAMTNCEEVRQDDPR